MLPLAMGLRTISRWRRKSWAPVRPYCPHVWNWKKRRSSRSKYINTGDVIERANRQVVRVGIGDNKPSPHQDSEVRITHLINVPAGHAHFKRLKWTGFNHFL